MSSWLKTLTAPCCTQLGDMGSTLNTMKDRYMYWNDDYYQKAQNLISQQQYQGKGATAFMQAVDTDINVLRPVYDGIGHASSACVTLQSAIEISSTKYDADMASIKPPTPPYHAYWELSASVFNNWREQLINMTLADTGSGGGAVTIISSVLINGNIYMYSGAYQAVEKIVQQDAAVEIQRCLTTDPSFRLPAYLNPQLDPSIAKNPDLAQQSALTQRSIQQSIELTKQEIQTYYQTAFDQLADAVEHDLTNWGTDLCNGHDDFQAAIRSSESYLTARDLFDLIYNDNGGSQSTTKPITITPYKTSNGKTGLLITIGGTDLGDWAWDTDLFTALQTGMDAGNPLLADVKAAIYAYMNEHPEMAGSEITFAGYSLGGMTAQQMAQAISNKSDAQLNRYNLHVAQMITYGAPVMGAPLNGVQYAMYDASYDPVPVLSSYENPLLHPLGIAVAAPYAIASIVAADALPWDLKLHHYIDPNGQYTGEIHNINDIGNTFVGDGGTPLMQNHMEYQKSSQLNAPITATTDIDATTLGLTEYFTMKNTDNVYAKLNQPPPPLIVTTPKGWRGALGK